MWVIESCLSTDELPDDSPLVLQQLDALQDYTLDKQENDAVDFEQDVYQERYQNPTDPAQSTYYPNGIILRQASFQLFADENFRAYFDTKVVNSLPMQIDAMILLFKPAYQYQFGNDQFSQQYHLNQLTSDQQQFVNQHAALLLKLFPHQKNMPLKKYYQCYLGLEINSSSPLAQSIMLPEGNNVYGNYFDSRLLDEQFLSAFGKHINKLKDRKMNVPVKIYLQENTNKYNNFFQLSDSLDSFIKNNVQKVPLSFYRHKGSTSTRDQDNTDYDFISMGPVDCEDVVTNRQWLFFPGNEAISTEPGKLIQINKDGKSYIGVKLPHEFLDIELVQAILRANQ